MKRLSVLCSEGTGRGATDDVVGAVAVLGFGLCREDRVGGARGVRCRAGARFCGYLCFCRMVCNWRR